MREILGFHEYIANWLVVLSSETLTVFDRKFLIIGIIDATIAVYGAITGISTISLACCSCVFVCFTHGSIHIEYLSTAVSRCWELLTTLISVWTRCSWSTLFKCQVRHMSRGYLSWIGRTFRSPWFFLGPQTNILEQKQSLRDACHTCHYHKSSPMEH